MKMSGWITLVPGFLALGAWCGLKQRGKTEDSPSPTVIGPSLRPPAASDLVRVWRTLSNDGRPEAVSQAALLLARLSAPEVLTLLLDAGKDDPWPASLAGTRLQALAERLAELDPDKALQAMNSRDSLERPLAAALGRVAALADGSKEREWAGHITGDEARSDFWRAFGAHADAPRMEPVFSAGMSATEAYAARRAEEDLPACQAWAAEHPEVQAKVAKITAARDPHQALAWVNSLPQKNAGELASIRSAVYEVWAATDPDAALAAFGGEPSPDSIRHSIYGIAKAMAKLPADKVLAAMARNSDTVMMQFPMTGSVAGAWLRHVVESDPATSVSMLFELPDSALRHDLIAKASTWWARELTPELRQNLEAALAREPPGGNHDAVITALVRGSSLRGDAETAFRWLESRRAGDNFENSARTMANALAGSGPAGLAAHWSGLPENVRFSVRPDLLRNWRLIDPIAADAWAGAHPGATEAPAPQAAEKTE